MAKKKSKDKEPGVASSRAKLVGEWLVTFEFDDEAIASELGTDFDPSDSESFPIARQELLASKGIPEEIECEFKENGTSIAVTDISGKSRAKRGTWEFANSVGSKLTIKVGRKRAVTLSFDGPDSFVVEDSLPELLPTTDFVKKSLFSRS